MPDTHPVREVIPNEQSSGVQRLDTGLQEILTLTTDEKLELLRLWRKKKALCATADQSNAQRA